MSKTKTVLIIVALLLISGIMLTKASKDNKEITQVSLYYNIDNPSEQYSRDLNNPKEGFVPIKEPVNLKGSSSPLFPVEGIN